jgi:hypothetical protein
MAFKTAERAIVSRIQRSRAQLEVDQAVLTAFETGETLADVVPESQAAELDRMIRNAVKLYNLATIVENRPTEYVVDDTDETRENGTAGQPMVEIAFIVKRKRVRSKSGDENGDASGDDSDTIEENDENEGENYGQ